MPRAVIADDEPLLAEALADRLHGEWPELEVAGIAHDGDAALEMIGRLRPEVVFLDIRMPARSGLEVARALATGARVPPAAVVFVTAYDQHALAAFEAAAIDYLVKPVSRERLASCVARVRARLSASAAGQAGGDPSAVLQRLVAQLQAQLSSPVAGPAWLRFLRASIGDVTRQIAVDDVLYFEARDKYVSVVTRDASALVRVALTDLLGQLDPQRFAQIHRSTVVNLDAIDTIRRDIAGRLFVHLRGPVLGREVKLAVSRQFAGQFRGM